jgi:phosphoglycolate phosphatase
MRQLGLQTDELLYVGDELRDIEACKKAGVRIVAVAWGYDPLPLLVSGNPDGIAKTPEELLRFVRRMQSGGTG